MDTVSKEIRSANMSAIHSKDTEPEIYLRHLLFSKGYRYRKNVSRLIGHPDLYFAKYHAVIFVNGCFWHRHVGCKYSYTPKSNLDFWEAKFQKNIGRDLMVRKSLIHDGYRCLTVWECTIKKMKKDPDFESEITQEIINFLNGNETCLEL